MSGGAEAGGARGGGVREAVVAAYAAEWGRVLAAVIRSTGDWDLAEECAQEAFTRALERWPGDGVPRRPGAWLTTVARNRALDLLRGAAAEGRAVRELAAAPERPPGPAAPPVTGDGRLELIFACCHPALPLPSRVALTLRSVAGLGTDEIARAFLVPEATMAQRLVRAKRKIRNAGIALRVPPAGRLAERVAGVLAVLYLIFNEGYAGSSSLVRPELMAEAVRLARVLADLLPEAGAEAAAPGPRAEAEGLLALMLLHSARLSARTGADGALVPLEEQDRTRWDAAGIAEGAAVLDRALHRRRPGPYQVQAAIAACHATAPAAAATDWPQIALLYGELARMTASPVVALNRAVAVGMAHGPQHGLALADALAPELDGYRGLHATRADLLRRLGRYGEAATAYRRALGLRPPAEEARYLRRRLGEMGS